MALRYYILREPGKEMVPLVPADQLPYQLQSIPCQLNHRQLSDSGWKFVCETKEPATVLPVSGTDQSLSSSPASAKFLAPDHRVYGPSFEMDTSPTPLRFVNEVAPSMCRSEVVATNRPKFPTSNNAQRITSPKILRYSKFETPPPSGIMSDPSKKEYCVHWLRTGQCDYTATGCRYKHIMPSKQKLRELGLDPDPLWFKEKIALKSRGPTWLQRRANDNKGEDEQGLVEITRPYVFPAFDAIKKNRMQTEINLEPDMLEVNEKLEKFVLGGKSKAAITQPKVGKSHSVNLIDLDQSPENPSSSLLPCIESSDSADSFAACTPTASSTESIVASAPKPAANFRAQQSKKLQVRRYSQISVSSDDECEQEDKFLSKRKVYPRRFTDLDMNTRRKVSELPAPKAAVAKKTGLLQSKYAGAMRKKLKNTHSQNSTNPVKSASD